MEQPRSITACKQQQTSEPRETQPTTNQHSKQRKGIYLSQGAAGWLVNRSNEDRLWKGSKRSPEINPTQTIPKAPQRKPASTAETPEKHANQTEAGEKERDCVQVPPTAEMEHVLRWPVARMEGVGCCCGCGACCFHETENKPIQTDTNRYKPIQTNTNEHNSKHPPMYSKHVSIILVYPKHLNTYENRMSVSDTNEIIRKQRTQAIMNWREGNVCAMNVVFRRLISCLLYLYKPNTTQTMPYEKPSVATLSVDVPDCPV
jgi:hypothetical protein